MAIKELELQMKNKLKPFAFNNKSNTNVSSPDINNRSMYSNKNLRISSDNGERSLSPI